MEEIHYKMYAFVLRQLSPLDKGIQVAHCCMEYIYDFSYHEITQQYIKTDKTLIIKNGGTSLDLQEYLGALRILAREDSNFLYKAFSEPDLDNITTCFCFIADSRVFDFINYPEIEDESYDDYIKRLGSKTNVMLRRIFKNCRLA